MQQQLREVLYVLAIEERYQQPSFYYLAHPQSSRTHQLHLLQILSNAVQFLPHVPVNLIREVVTVQHVDVLATLFDVAVVQPSQCISDSIVLGLEFNHQSQALPRFTVFLEFCCGYFGVGQGEGIIGWWQVAEVVEGGRGGI